MDAFSITIVMLVFLLAGGVKGVVGLGLPTVAVALLSATFGIEAALPLLVIPSFVTNVWQGAIGGQAMALFRRFGIALALIPVTTWVGYRYVFIAAPEAMERVLGAVLVVYAGLGLRAARFAVPAGAEPVLTPIVGLVNGIVTGVTGTFVVPIVMYLEALGLDRDQLVQMMGIAFSVSTAALAAVLIAARGVSARRGVRFGGGGRARDRRHGGRRAPARASFSGRVPEMAARRPRRPRPQAPRRPRPPAAPHPVDFLRSSSSSVERKRGRSGFLAPSRSPGCRLPRWPGRKTRADPIFSRRRPARAAVAPGLGDPRPE